MNSLRTRTWPAASGSTGASRMAKFSACATPVGREMRMTCRLFTDVSRSCSTDMLASIEKTLLLLPSNDALSLRPQNPPVELDDVAALEELGRLHAEAHALRRAGDDHVSRQQRHELAEMRKDLGDGEDHVAGVALLPDGAVDGERERDRLRVGDLVGRHQPRPERTERVEALALHPLAAALGLPLALRDIVGEAIAGDLLERVALSDALRLGPDNDPELDLPVHGGRSFRPDDIVVGALDGGDRFEYDGVVRDWVAGFFGVLSVIEPDADELGNAADRGADPRPVGTTGIFSRLIAAIARSFSGDSHSGVMSGTSSERSRITPLASKV